MVPVLGNIKLGLLNSLKVQCLYCAKLDEGLSTGTVRHLYVILLPAPKQAVKWKVIWSNVCESVTPPRCTLHKFKPMTKCNITQLTRWMTLRNSLRHTRSRLERFGRCSLIAARGQGSGLNACRGKGGESWLGYAGNQPEGAKSATGA